MAKAAEPTGRLNPLKKLYFELGKQLNAGEVKALKDLLSEEQLTKEEAENVDTARGLFKLLTEKGFISEDNLELLKELFETIDRPHLKDKVIQFQQNRDARRKRNACELKIKISSNDDRLKIIFFGSEVQVCPDHRREGAPQKIEVHLQTIEGLLVVEFRDGCIECVVKCKTMDSLETLWSQYKSGVLQEVFQKAIITDELLKSLHAEYITMEVTISEEEYRKCREEVKAYEEFNKAYQEYRKTRKEWRKASQEVHVQKKSGKERHGLEATEEEMRKAEQRWREADKGRREAFEEYFRKNEAWVSFFALYTV